MLFENDENVMMMQKVRHLNKLAEFWVSFDFCLIEWKSFQSKNVLHTWHMFDTRDKSKQTETKKNYDKFLFNDRWTSWFPFSVCGQTYWLIFFFIMTESKSLTIIWDRERGHRWVNWFSAVYFSKNLAIINVLRHTKKA